MFEKFGELGSIEEINELAENLFNEGDEQSIFTLAEENGIPKDLAEMYISGDIPFLTDAATAAIGKIDIEAKDLKAKEIMLDWAEYIKSQCGENEELARQVRKKSLKGCIAAILKWSFEHQMPVDREILQAAGVNASKVTLGIPGAERVKKIIKEYYGGES